MFLLGLVLNFEFKFKVLFVSVFALLHSTCFELLGR